MTIADITLFASDDLIARHVVAGDDRSICFVTFDSYTDQRRLDRPGFGEGYFQPRGIDAVHIVSRENRWYQHAELPDLLAAVRAATAGYAHIITYGSSMGGYAALTYGSAAGATIGIALSPQYSVDPAAPPFEQRWAEDAARIDFQDFAAPPLPLQYIVYDPRDRLDRAHAALFTARSPTIGIRIPHGGHPVGGYLNETGAFAALFSGVRLGTITGETVGAFEQDLRVKRRLSGQYFFTLSIRVPPRRLRLKVALARMAIAASPGDPPYISQLAQMLDLIGEHDEAERHHRHAIELSRGNLHTVHNLVLHHQRRGRYDEAERLAASLAAEHPDLAMLQRNLAKIRRLRRRSRLLLGLDRLLLPDGPIGAWLNQRKRRGDGQD